MYMYTHPFPNNENWIYFTLFKGLSKIVHWSKGLIIIEIIVIRDK